MKYLYQIVFSFDVEKMTIISFLRNFDFITNDFFSLNIQVIENEENSTEHPESIEELGSLLEDKSVYLILDIYNTKSKFIPEGITDPDYFEYKEFINLNSKNDQVSLTIYSPEDYTFLIDYLEQFQSFRKTHLEFSHAHGTDLEAWHRYIGFLPPIFAELETIESNNSEKLFYFQEKLPYHEHFLHEENLSFNIAPIMVVPPLIFKYIPKQIWNDYNGYEANIDLINGAKYLVLFKNVFDSLKEEKIRKMIHFRRVIGMDSITHEICFKVKDIGYIDPTLPVVITLKNVQKGFTRVTRYLDKNGNLVEPQKAQTMEIKEYLEDGETCVLEEVKKKGIFGWR